MPRKIRLIRIDGDIAYVPLTKGYEAVIDAADAEFLGQWNWCADAQKGGPVYAVRIVRVDGRPFSLRMHRVLGIDAVLVDHKDNDGLNNRRGNLRAANSAQNATNAGLRANNTSGVKGVIWAKRDGKWVSRIRSGGGRIYLGSFKCRTAAQFAYAKASAELHGDFGRVA